MTLIRDQNRTDAPMYVVHHVVRYKFVVSPAPGYCHPGACGSAAGSSADHRGGQRARDWAALDDLVMCWGLGLRELRMSLMIAGPGLVLIIFEPS